MSNYSTNNSFNDILERLLANVDDSLDKRQGSIIYDALAPAAAELAQCYIALDVYTDQTYLLTATGKNLDNRAVDYGVTRNIATRMNNKYGKMFVLPEPVIMAHSARVMDLLDPSIKMSKSNYKKKK